MRKSPLIPTTEMVYALRVIPERKSSIHPVLKEWQFLATRPVHSLDDKLGAGEWHFWDIDRLKSYVKSF